MFGTMASENCSTRDYAMLDSHQLFFYSEEELEDGSFYQSTAPSEDIWKKFELLPTPPLSPGRLELDCLLSRDGWDPGPEIFLPSAKTLDLLVSGLLTDRAVSESFFCDALEEEETVIKQDCMWSSFNAHEKLEKMMGQRMGQRVALLRGGYVAPPSPGDSPGGQSRCMSESSSSSSSSSSSGSDSDSSELDYGSTEGRGTHGLDLQPRFSPRTAGLETPSDSEEEEIDVVTVEKRSAMTPGDAGAISASSNTNTAGVRLQSEPCDHALKRCHFPIHQQHNYAAPSPPSPPPTKRWRTEAAATAVAVRSAARGEPARLPAFTRYGSAGNGGAEGRLTSSGNSTSSSDSEESERRRTHNILERQRRDGLRSSFLGLRDVIPELCRNDKAAKVMILRKAGEYAKRLVAEEHRLLLEKRQAEARQHQLLRKIESLKR